MVGAVFGTRWLWVKYGVDIQGVTVVLAIAASGIAYVISALICANTISKDLIELVRNQIRKRRGGENGRIDFMRCRFLLLVLPLILATISSCGKESGQEVRPGPLPSPSNLRLLEGPLPANAVHGQVIYVPIYSSIYSHTSNRIIDLTATLSIHNTDARRDIFIRRANYFDTDGKLLEERAPKPIQLAPLQTISLVVELADTRGGAGANFIVEWVAEAGVRQPVVEAIMVNVSLSNAFAFTSPGRVVEAIAP